jgi:hypothetical protein
VISLAEFRLKTEELFVSCHSLATFIILVRVTVILASQLANPQITPSHLVSRLSVSIISIFIAERECVVMSVYKY